METKTLDTLVEDIYSLMTTDSKDKIKEEDLSVFLKGVSNVVVSALSKREEKDGLRLSMVGQPDRKVWNRINKTPMEELSGATLIKFMYGSLLEELLIFLTKTAGHTVADEQATLFVDDVEGHTDGTIDGVLVDYKSASSFGFKKFKDGSVVNDDPFGYIAQLSSYAEAMGKTEAAFVAIDKTTGELAVCNIHHMDMINATNRIKDIKGFMNAEVPPPRCHAPVADGKSGNMRLDTGCFYCDFKFSCWSDANDGRGIRTFNYSNGPKHLVVVAETPKVEELTSSAVYGLKS
jgi:hypothetical protein